MAQLSVPPKTSHQPAGNTKPFSVWLYLLIVVLLSWPLQFWFVFKASTSFDRYLFSSLSMIMVSVATFIAGRFVFKDGFAGAGWSLGKPKHYLAVFLLAVCIWLVPSVIETAAGWHLPTAPVFTFGVLLLFLLRFAGTLVPGFGEEFGWRGYLLPRLTVQHGAKKGLLIHAFIWWAWHLPVLIGMSMKETAAGGNELMNVVTVVLVSVVPSMLHAVIFAYIWTKTKSIWVATFYHAAFDEVRDALEASAGFGSFVEIWQMVVITLIGAWLLWKADWKALLGKRVHNNAHKKTLYNNASG